MCLHLKAVRQLSSSPKSGHSAQLLAMWTFVAWHHLGAVLLLPQCCSV